MQATVWVEGDGVGVLVTGIGSVDDLKRRSGDFQFALFHADLVSHWDITRNVDQPDSRAHSIAGVFEPIEGAPALVNFLVNAGWSVASKDVFRATSRGHGTDPMTDVHYVLVLVEGPTGEELHRVRVSVTRDCVDDFFRTRGSAAQQVVGFWDAFIQDAPKLVLRAVHDRDVFDRPRTRKLTSLELTSANFDALNELNRSRRTGG